MEVVVFRLGHRYVRDDRVTTHVFLSARAFGADKVIYSGKKDEKLEKKIQDITEMWGGPFNVEYEKNWGQKIKDWKKEDGEVIHLTVYGIPIQDALHEIRKSRKRKMVVVGGAKVPKSVYELADWNISVTSQPHSEISALSVFLHEFFRGQELSRAFRDAKIRVIPHPNGKHVVKMER